MDDAGLVLSSLSIKGDRQDRMIAGPPVMTTVTASPAVKLLRTTAAPRGLPRQMCDQERACTARCTASSRVAGYRHHPAQDRPEEVTTTTRMFGESKYGISRTFRVIST